MSLLILSAAAAVYLFLWLASDRTSSDASVFPPKVPSPLGGYYTGLLYALNPSVFFSKCGQQYGPVYRVLLGSRRLIIISSANAISYVSSASPRLCHTTHKEMFYAVAGITSSYAHLHRVTMRFFPIFDKFLSPNSLGETTRGFGFVLLSQIDNLLQEHRGEISVKQLANSPLYTAANLVIFGSTFPNDTYGDLQTLNHSVPHRFNRMLLWFWPSYAARWRLLNSLERYLRQEEVINCGGQFALALMKRFKDDDIQPSEGAQLFLILLWGMHFNTMNVAFFLLSFLLCNPDAFAQVQTEVDLVIENFGSLEALLEADPDQLDDPSFGLLASAILETMRFTGLHTGLRKANCDMDLEVGGRTVLIKKGETIFGNAQAVHMDAEFFPNPGEFVVDRFVQRPYQRKRLPTEGEPFYSFGIGRNICKGRWMAMYELKVLLIILLHKFDFSPAGKSSEGWHFPKVHPRSTGTMHTDEDLFVRLSPRQIEVGPVGDRSPRR